MGEGSRSRPARDAARERVLQYASAGLRLPPVRALAREAGVSAPTMCSVLADLRKQGKIGPWQRKDAPETSRGKAPTLPRGTRSHKVYERILNDIVLGRYDALPHLPSAKELCETYGVCFSALKNVLNALIDNGALERRRKRYHVVRGSGRRGSGQVVLVTSEKMLEFVEMYELVRTKTYPLISTMERECGRRNLRFAAKPFRGDHGILSDLEDVVGVVVMFDPHFPPVDQVNTLVRSLLKRGCPVLIMDAYKPENYGDLPPSRNLFVCGDSGRMDGHAVGHFLLSRGHRRVCVFAHEPDLFWSESRVEGVRTAYETAGFPDAITVLCAASPDRSSGAPVDAAENNPTVNDTMRRQAAQVKEDVRRYTARFEPSPFRERVLGEMEEMLVHLSGVWTRFIPLCEQALAIPDVTAWVAAEDQIAVYALLPFLASRKMKVPRDLSVIGFNNIPESITANLTTFDFNVHGQVLAALDLFLNPGQARPHVNRKTNVVAVDGFVVNRGSVGTIAR